MVQRTRLFKKWGTGERRHQLTFPIVIYLGVAGTMFLLSGVITLLVANLKDDDDDDFEDFDTKLGSGRDDKAIDPATLVGIICILIGVWLIVSCIILACYAKKKYKELSGVNGDAPGRVVSGHMSPILPPLAPIPVQPVGSPPPLNRVYNLPPVRGYRRPRNTDVPAEDQMEYSPFTGEQYSVYPPLAPAQYPTLPRWQPRKGGTGREGSATRDPSAPPEGHDGHPDLPGMALVPAKRDEAEFSSPPPYAPEYNPPM
ncbi:uncharacterized protein [Macrobrachium rosenbergii]|uniref:uncharacterized protein n=1 Tax=Macrobrachium rosenbergii TaxID=79674 RepID=UPI0034D5F161